jgi:serine/threonine protein kinase/tetratricopeptide (TPR) repeat protein
MNPDDPTHLDEHLSSVLIAWDKALAAGARAVAVPAQETPADLRPDLERDLACVQLLRQVLPRRPGAQATLPAGNLGRFVLRRELGRGAFGMVFLAYDPQLGREVALKVPRPDVLVSPDLRERFVREARAAAGLDHPNVVAVHEAGEVGPLCYIASAYCPGPTLAAWLKERRESVPVPVAANLLALLAEALQHAHDRGVVHRDLKPGNILLAPNPKSVTSNPITEIRKPKSEIASAPEGNALPESEAVSDFGFRISDFSPKVADFGLAKLTAALAAGTADGGDLTQTGAVVGTPTYMAPEQAEGRSREVGPPADTYALGAILYELLTGRPPFVGETTWETLEQVRTHEPVPPRRLRPKLPRDLETICLKCLEKEPRKRYPSAGALGADLRSFLAGEPIKARPIRAWERAGKWARRRPAAAALLAVSCGSALALLAVILGYNTQLRDKNADLAAGIVQLNQEKDRTKAALAAEAKRRKQTHAALEMLSSAGIDEWLSRQRRLLPEHRQFLEKVLAANEELARDTGQEQASRAGVARAYFRIGYIRHRLGQAASAEAAYKRACKLYQQLAADYATGPIYRVNLASSYNNLGRLLQAQNGRRQDAERAFQAALELRRRLVADFPTVPRYLGYLAQSYNNLGTFLEGAGRAQGAERAYRQALRIQQRLAAKFPRKPDYREALARTHNNLGALLAGTDPQQAERAFRAALELNRQLVIDHPTVADYRHQLATSYDSLANLVSADRSRAKDAIRCYREALKRYQQLAAEAPIVPAFRQGLARCHSNLGAFLTDLRQAEKAEREYRAALQLQQQLAADFPTEVDYHSELANTMNYLADVLRTRKELRPARDLLDQAAGHLQIALKTKPRDPNCRRLFRDNRAILIETLLDGGEYSTAADTVPQLLQAAFDPAYDVYVAACFLSRCVRLAKHDLKLSEVQRQQRAQLYADRAIASLGQAVRHGFKDVAQLKKNKDLEPLRSRADFKSLCAKLQRKK